MSVEINNLGLGRDGVVKPVEGRIFLGGGGVFSLGRWRQQALGERSPEVTLQSE